MLSAIAWKRGVPLRARVLSSTAVLLYSAVTALSVTAWLRQGSSAPHLLGPVVQSAAALGAALLAFAADFTR